MKKTILASAVLSALFGLSACQYDMDSNTASSPNPEVSGASNLATASASFSVGFPQSEVSAAFIDTGVASIKLHMVRMDDIFNAIALYESTENYFDWHLLDIDEKESGISEMYQAYKAKQQVTEQEAHQFGRLAIALADYLYTYNDTLGFELPMPEQTVEMTPTNNSATLSGLAATGYLIFAEQYDGENQLIAYEPMAAFLGEGSNAIALNMMSAKWTFVDQNNVPQPFTPTLLTSDTAKAKWLYDDAVERNMVDFLTEGEFNQVKIEGIQRLKHGAQVSGYADMAGDIPTDADGKLLDLTNVFVEATLSNATQSQSIDDLIRGWNSWEYTSYQDEQENWLASGGGGGEVSSNFYQVYDARLTNNKTLFGGDFISIAADSYFHSEDQETEVRAGFFIVGNDDIGTPRVDGDLRKYESPEESDYYQGKHTYFDQSGVEQTLYVVNKWNWRTTLQTPVDHADLSQVDSITVPDGQTINGWAVEMFSSQTWQNGDWNETISGVDVDESKPTHNPEDLMMAYAMSSLVKTEGLVASAQAHPLGENCASITAQWVDQAFTYGWVDGQWQIGEVNWSAIYNYNSVTGRNEFDPELGKDMNGDGVVSPFETGVVYNWTLSENEGLNAVDLDGDGVAEEYEAVSGVEYSGSDPVMEVCATPVRLKASALTIPRDDFIYNNEETATESEVLMQETP